MKNWMNYFFLSHSVFGTDNLSIFKNYQTSQNYLVKQPYLNLTFLVIQLLLKCLKLMKIVNQVFDKKWVTLKPIQKL